MELNIIGGVIAGLIVIFLVAAYGRIRSTARNRRTDHNREKETKPSTRAGQLFTPAGIDLPRGSSATVDAWAGTTASGYGKVVRSQMRRKGITPAQYARGKRN